MQDTSTPLSNQSQKINHVNEYIITPGVKGWSLKAIAEREYWSNDDPVFQCHARGKRFNNRTLYLAPPKPKALIRSGIIYQCSSRCVDCVQNSDNRQDDRVVMFHTEQQRWFYASELDEGEYGYGSDPPSSDEGESRKRTRIRKSSKKRRTYSNGEEEEGRAGMGSKDWQKLGLKPKLPGHPTYRPKVPTSFPSARPRGFTPPFNIPPNSTTTVLSDLELLHGITIGTSSNISDALDDPNPNVETVDGVRDNSSQHRQNILMQALAVSQQETKMNSHYKDLYEALLQERLQELKDYTDKLEKSERKIRQANLTTNSLKDQITTLTEGKKKSSS